MDISFGRWLRTRRRALDLTQDDLARQVCCSVVTIRKIEADERRPSRQIAERLADQLQIAQDDRVAIITLARDEPYLTAAVATTMEPDRRATPRPPMNLPAPLTELIGRKQDIAALRNTLTRSTARLLTLTGPPGIGKTSLGIAVAWDVQAAFSDGAAFVALAPISDSALVLATIARRLGVTEKGDQPLLEWLTIALQEKRFLLVLDNFEHVVDTAPLVVELLEACPGLKMLITSRTALHVRGERLYPVPPLLLPDLMRRPAVGILARNPAVALFVERTQAVLPDFRLTDQHAGAVAAICVRLDGLPLAIELAAAQAKIFTPSALLTRLNDRFALLKGGTRDQPARHQTLRTAIDWSYDLLSPDEQRLFQRLAVFVGGWTLDAAEAVCRDGETAPLADRGIGQHDRWEQHTTGAAALRVPVSPYLPVNDSVLDGLRALVDKSLVHQAEGLGGEPRFHLLETLREYALERLEASGTAAVARRQHADYFVMLAERAAPKLVHMQSLEWLARLDTEQANLRAVLAWSIGPHGHLDLGLRLAVALRSFWVTQSYSREGYAWLEHAMSLSRADNVDPAVRARVARASGVMYVLLWGDDSDQGISLLEEGITSAQEQSDRAGVAEALLWLALLVRERGDYTRAEALATESLALYRAEGDTAGIALGLLGRGDDAFFQGQLGQATAQYEAALTLSRESGAHFWYGWAVNHLGMVAYMQADYARAQSLLLESRALFQELHFMGGAATVLLDLGRVARAQGDLIQAARLFAEGLVLVREFQGSGKRDIAYALSGLAGVAAAHEQAEHAARLLGAVAALRESVGIVLPPVYRPAEQRDVVTIRAMLGDEAFEAAWATGRTLTCEQAIDEALRAVRHTT